VLTLLGLAIVPRYLHHVDELVQASGDENAELLKQAGMMRRKRMHRKYQ
jgi:hypothetical protein